jgi:lysophospholipase L1-like esterase
MLSALPSTILILYLLLAGKLFWVPAATYLAVVILGLAGLIVLRDRDWLIRLTLMLGSLNLVVAAPELALRVAGYHAPSGVSYGGLRPEFRAYFEADSDLMWRFRQDQPGVNSLGFRGREVEIPKPLGKRRLLIIGDSCADQDYASLLERALNYQSSSSRSRSEFECVVLAVPGYSSYQGKIIAEKYGRLMEADLAFVCFGWNDHWLAYGATDAEMGGGPAASLTCGLYRSSRLFQLAFEWVHGGDQPPEKVIDMLRVPPAQFRENLVAINYALAEAGTSTVFVTAPTGHEINGVPPYLIEQQLAIDTMAVLTMHQQYADIVRGVANETGAGLLDLENRLNGIEQSEDIFTNDGIHFTRLGLKEVAFEMYKYLQDAGQLNPPNDSNF